jgi:hypothetical protein
MSIVDTVAGWFVEDEKPKKRVRDESWKLLGISPAQAGMITNTLFVKRDFDPSVEAYKGGVTFGELSVRGEDREGGKPHFPLVMELTKGEASQVIKNLMKFAEKTPVKAESPEVAALKAELAALRADLGIVTETATEVEVGQLLSVDGQLVRIAKSDKGNLTLRKA